MIVRVWTTALAPGAKDRYLAFANEQSLPMLRDIAETLMALSQNQEFQ